MKLKHHCLQTSKTRVCPQGSDLRATPQLWFDSNSHWSFLFVVIERPRLSGIISSVEIISTFVLKNCHIQFLLKLDVSIKWRVKTQWLIRVISAYNDMSVCFTLFFGHLQPVSWCYCLELIPLFLKANLVWNFTEHYKISTRVSVCWASTHDISCFFFS